MIIIFFFKQPPAREETNAQITKIDTKQISNPVDQSDLSRALCVRRWTL